MDGQPKKPIWKKWWFWVLLFFGLPFLSLLMMASMAKDVPSTATVSSVTPQPTVTQPVITQAPKYVFDVPSLLGKTIDEIRTTLGEPTDGKLTDPNAEQLRLGTKEWDNTFQKNGKELLVTFNIANRKVIDLFISTDDPSGQTKDKQHLLELGNITTNSPSYKVEFVKTIKNPNFFTGVKITSN